MKKQNSLILAILISLFIPVRAAAPVVHAVLFYSPSCSHCHTLISEELPPILHKYGEQLDIIAVNVQQVDGQALYQAAIKHFQIPKDRLGVPTLIIDTEVLVGTDEIMMVFPKLIEDFLAQGGMDWPKIPGFHKTIFKTPAPANKVESAELLQMPTVELSLTEKLARDPIGNGLAIFVLIGMIFVIFHTLVLFKHPNSPLKATKIVPILCLLGLAVSSYMVYIEMYHLTAVCGPIGDCNMVQQSEYAKLFGVLPIGILGFIAYIAILLAWSIGQYASEKIAQIGRLTLFGLTLLGTLFSIYLTFLEPFVIGATCLWCLTSAIIMTSLLWNTRAIK